MTGVNDELLDLDSSGQDDEDHVRTDSFVGEAALMEALMPTEEELARARDVRAQRRSAAEQDPFAAGVDFTDDEWSD